MKIISKWLDTRIRKYDVFKKLNYVKGLKTINKVNFTV